ncbi:MAG: hypothetical protein SGPRY_002570, partial [Prymnesium sp.]
DHEPLFRQESFFAYLLGVLEPDCYATIELPSGRTTLFVPRLPAEYAVWMGEIKSAASFRDRYLVDEAAYTDEITAHIAASLAACASSSPSPSSTPVVYTLDGLNSDSGLNIADVLPVDKYVPPGATVVQDK